MAEGKSSRRQFLTRVARGAGAAATGALAWGWLLERQAQASPFALRPPGALPERDFLATCIKCGQCVAACPYDTLRLAGLSDRMPLGTPHFTPRDVPCYLCENLPCVVACPTGALAGSLTDPKKSDMGVAVLSDQENCLSWQGLRCEICYRDCPVQNAAISVVNHPRKKSKHALFVPVVHAEHCTGCGVCERVCPLPEPAIRVLPRTLARGAPAEHYGTIDDAESLLNRPFAAPPSPGATPSDESALDYLNAEEMP